MTLQKRLEILQEQYNNMIKYRALCNGMNCTINYSSKDYDREGELLRKIQETKEWISNKKAMSAIEPAKTDFATIHTAIIDAINLGLDLSKEHSSPGIVRMHIEISKIMKRFPTLGEKLDNV